MFSPEAADRLIDPYNRLWATVVQRTQVLHFLIITSGEGSILWT